ncbi:hypothetical protein G7070_06230 [Propioniciclava coleopterorum]|uniref:Uncharacterized protein n=1 Tax=Propioniciclava coleopterorum TaxID=2714937 RepID=A0A6G7Y5L6_9ACTN|nr:hypothetical protein [Propioniciclava coleopterorum]QIK71938.1 hypothetical protein G7070_06230 [Propioniciclava coleopterorum]
MAWIGRALFLLCSAVLVIWAVEGLTRVDQSTSILPFMSGDTTGAPVIFVGVFWGILLTMGAGSFVGGSGAGLHIAGRRRTSDMTEVGVGVIDKVSRTGLEVNDVPQYDIKLTVTPADGPAFPARIRTLVDTVDAVALVVGNPLPLHYSPRTQDVVLADPSEPEVGQALLRWRIGRGLLDPRLVGARTRGVTVPASVLSLRPTGVRREGHVELSLTLLLTPEDGRSPWEASTTTFVYPQALDRLQVGSPVYAMYEPHDPATVAVTIQKETVA